METVKRIVVYKDHAPIGRSGAGSGYIEHFGAPNGKDLLIFVLPRLTLDRKCLYQHLQRTPLTALFNGGGVAVQFEDNVYRQIGPSSRFDRDEDGKIVTYSILEPVWVVHAASEVYRGSAHIRSVVLAYNPHEDAWQSFLPHLPQIYRGVTAQL